MRATDHERLVQHLLGDSVVLNVLDAKSEELGDGVYRFKAEIREWMKRTQRPVAGLGGGCWGLFRPGGRVGCYTCGG